MRMFAERTSVSTLSEPKRVHSLKPSFQIISSEVSSLDARAAADRPSGAREPGHVALLQLGTGLDADVSPDPHIPSPRLGPSCQGRGQTL